MYIKGVGTIPYRIYDKPSHLLAYDAISKTLNDADLSMNDIDAIVCSTLEWFYTGEFQRHFASMLSGLLKTRVPIIRTPAACAGGGMALCTAVKLGLSNEFNNILVIGTEKLHGHTNNSECITNEFMMAAESIWEQQEGLNFPASNALVAQAYLKKFPDATMDDLALISFKNHENAYLNENAFFYNKKINLEQIKKSPIVCSPLRLFDCSISVDGAAACVITKDKTDVKIMGSAYCTDYLPPFERDDITTWDGNLKASEEAYKQANVSVKDIDLAEMHDAFTIVELIAYEDLGFCKKGQGSKLIRDGTVKLDGKLPVNPSGGLKAKGHPVSATGLGQIYELVKQLRKEAKDRQVSKAKIALAHNVGGAGGTVTINILKKIGG